MTKKDEEKAGLKDNLAKPAGEKKPAVGGAAPQEIKIENLKAAFAGTNGQPSAEAAELKEKLAAAEDKYLRLCAEFDNFRKRTESEKTEFSKYAAGNFIEAVLPVLDSFERSQKTLETQCVASEQRIASEQLEEVKKGFVLIHKQLEDILQKFGVQKMETSGKPFDPRFHEAVLQKEADQPAHTVLEELQTGYVMHDKVLRPAMVVVAK